MWIISSLFWMIAGGVYVAYKLLKENSRTIKESSTGIIIILVVCGLTIFPISIGSGMIERDEEGGVLLTLFGLAMLIVFAISCFIFVHQEKHQSPESHKQQIEKNIAREKERIENGVIEWSSIFKNHGYNIPEEYIMRMVSDNYSRIYSHTKTIPIVYCYWWICGKRLDDLDKLSDTQLDELLGAKIRELPLDQNCPRGEAYLRREILVKNYILQRENLEYHKYPTILNRLEERCLKRDDYRESLYKHIDDCVNKENLRNQ